MVMAGSFPSPTYMAKWIVSGSGISANDRILAGFPSVPDGNYFVLGDNRDNSLDSRYWGFVADSLVKGRPFVIYYSYSPDSVDTFAWLTHIRWGRLGERIR